MTTTTCGFSRILRRPTMPNMLPVPLPQRLPAKKPDAALSAALPPDGRSVAVSRPPKGKPRGRRVNQERIDKMAALRRQALSFEEIAERLGCSERTARRYVGHILPALQRPRQDPDPGTDPRELRAQLLKKLLRWAYIDSGVRAVTMVYRPVPGRSDTWEPEYDLPPSIAYMNAAEKLIREALAKLGEHSIRYLPADFESQVRFFRETLGWLRSDYIWYHKLAQEFGGPNDTGEGWLPPWERPPEPKIEYANPFGLPED